MVRVIAHRGCPPLAPENSLRGIRLAAEEGADAVEVDVRITLDRVPVLMHDWSPWRMARLPGPLLLYPWWLLRRFRLRGGEPIPSLAQALSALPEGVVYALDMKEPWPLDRSMRLVRELGREARAEIWSHHGSVIQRAARHVPRVEVVAHRSVVEPEEVALFLAEATAWGASGVSLQPEAVTAALVERIHAAGLKAYTSHVPGLPVSQLVEAGVDGIVTDFPREVSQELARAGVR